MTQANKKYRYEYNSDQTTVEHRRLLPRSPLDLEYVLFHRRILHMNCEAECDLVGLARGTWLKKKNMMLTRREPG